MPSLKAASSSTQNKVAANWSLRGAFQAMQHFMWPLDMVKIAHVVVDYVHCQFVQSALKLDKGDSAEVQEWCCSTALVLQ